MCTTLFMYFFILFHADMSPQRNKFYTPSADGCGSMGMRIDTEYLPAVQMETCCNAHDICYDTCNKDKEVCDLDFKRCLYAYCDTHERSAVGNLVVKGCKAAAKMLFTGTITLGCKSYLDSQGRACYCPTDSNTRSNNNNNNADGKRKTKYNADSDYASSTGYQKQKSQQYGWKSPNDL